MPESIFIADPTRLLISAVIGIAILLLMIIKFKINPILSLLVSALFIGLCSGMGVLLLATTVQKGAGKTLEGIVLLIGLGSMFGGLLEVSGGAKRVAQTLVNKFGEKKSGIALGVTGLIVGTTVYFEAGVMILMPLAFSLAKKTNKSTLFYAIPLLAGLATGFAFIPPSTGSVLVANILNVDLGLLILVGIPTGVLALIFGGIFWSKFIGKKIFVPVPNNVEQEQNENDLPTFKSVILIIFIPLVLILLSTLSAYVVLPSLVKSMITFLGTPFVALIIAIFVAMAVLGKKRKWSSDDIKNIFENSLKPTANILLVITGGGIISEVLQVCGMGEFIGSALENSGLPIIIIAFLIAALIRICVGAAVVPMTMTAGIMMSMPSVATLSPLYLAAMALAISAGSTAFSHFNDSGFWMASSLLKMNEKDTLKAWTIMETIIGFTGLICALVISLFA